MQNKTKIIEDDDVDNNIDAVVVVVVALDSIQHNLNSVIVQRHLDISKMHSYFCNWCNCFSISAKIIRRKE